MTSAHGTVKLSSMAPQLSSTELNNMVVRCSSPWFSSFFPLSISQEEVAEHSQCNCQQDTHCHCAANSKAATELQKLNNFTGVGDEQPQLHQSPGTMEGRSEAQRSDAGDASDDGASPRAVAKAGKDVGQEALLGAHAYRHWTAAEDELLRGLVEEHGTTRNWNLISQHMCAHPGSEDRTGKSCRLRWVNHLKSDLKRGTFTAEEDLVIMQAHIELGNRWTMIAKRLPGRTDNAIKNRWHSTLKKKVQQQDELRQHMRSAARIAEVAQQTQAAALLSWLADNIVHTPQDATLLHQLLFGGGKDGSAEGGSSSPARVSSNSGTESNPAKLQALLINLTAGFGGMDGAAGAAAGVPSMLNFLLAPQIHGAGKPQSASASPASPDALLSSVPHGPQSTPMLQQLHDILGQAGMLTSGCSGTALLAATHAPQSHPSIPPHRHTAPDNGAGMTSPTHAATQATSISKLRSDVRPHTISPAGDGRTPSPATSIRTHTRSPEAVPVTTPTMPSTSSSNRLAPAPDTLAAPPSGSNQTTHNTTGIDAQVMAELMRVAAASAAQAMQPRNSQQAGATERPAPPGLSVGQMAWLAQTYKSKGAAGLSQALAGLDPPSSLATSRPSPVSQPQQPQQPSGSTGLVSNPDCTQSSARNPAPEQQHATSTATYSPPHPGHSANSSPCEASAGPVCAPKQVSLDSTLDTCKDSSRRRSTEDNKRTRTDAALSGCHGSDVDNVHYRTQFYNKRRQTGLTPSRAPSANIPATPPPTPATAGLPAAPAPQGWEGLARQQMLQHALAQRWVARMGVTAQAELLAPAMAAPAAQLMSQLASVGLMTVLASQRQPQPDPMVAALLPNLSIPQLPYPRLPASLPPNAAAPHTGLSAEMLTSMQMLQMLHQQHQQHPQQICTSQQSTQAHMLQSLLSAGERQAQELLQDQNQQVLASMQQPIHPPLDHMIGHSSQHTSGASSQQGALSAARHPMFGSWPHSHPLSAAIPPTTADGVGMASCSSAQQTGSVIQPGQLSAPTIPMTAAAAAAAAADAMMAEGMAGEDHDHTSTVNHQLPNWCFDLDPGEFLTTPVGSFSNLSDLSNLASSHQHLQHHQYHRQLGEKQVEAPSLEFRTSASFTMPSLAPHLRGSSAGGGGAGKDSAAGGVFRGSDLLEMELDGLHALVSDVPAAEHARGHSASFHGWVGAASTSATAYGSNSMPDGLGQPAAAFGGAMTGMPAPAMPHSGSQPGSMQFLGFDAAGTPMYGSLDVQPPAPPSM